MHCDSNHWWVVCMEHVLSHVWWWHANALVHQSYSCQWRRILLWRHPARLQHTELQQWRQRRKHRQRQHYSYSTGRHLLQLLLLLRSFLYCCSGWLRPRHFLRWRELRLAMPYDLFVMLRFASFQRNCILDLRQLQLKACGTTLWSLLFIMLCCPCCTPQRIRDRRIEQNHPCVRCASQSLYDLL